MGQLEPLGTVFEAETRRQLAVLGPDVARLWDLTRLPATASLLTSKAELGQKVQRSRVAITAMDEVGELGPASRELAKAQHAAAIRRWEGEIAALDGQIALAAERDRLTAERPEGCFCLGLGGRGVLGTIDGERIWSEWCGCAEGLGLRAVADAALVEAEREEVARLAAEATARREHERRGRLAKANIPPLFAECTLDTFPSERKQGQVLDHLREFGEPGARPRSVFLWGLPGRGKTGLSVAALKAWIDAGRSGVFVTVPALLDWLRPAQGQAGMLPRTVDVTGLADVPLLVLDDLGGQKTTAWARERLFVLINHRHDHKLPTIFTSNFSLGETAVLLAGDGEAVEGERIVWRIKEMSSIYELRGKDLRA